MLEKPLSVQENKIMGNHISEQHKTKAQERLEHVLSELEKRNIEPTILTDGKISFMHKDKVCTYWPISNWASGESITKGRGINNMLKQLDNE